MERNIITVTLIWGFVQQPRFGRHFPLANSAEKKNKQSNLKIILPQYHVYIPSRNYQSAINILNLIQQFFLIH